MSSYHEAVKRVLSEFNRFLKVTLLSETLSSNAENERKKILKLLQKLFNDYDSLAPSSGDEGSVSSFKDSINNSLDESRNTVDSSHGSEEDGYADNIPDTTVKVLSNPIKMGYLDRRQEYLIASSWQKRYCVLHRNILFIFKKPTDKKQQGAFFITGYEFRESPQLVKEEKKKDCCFELVYPGKKSYQFLCESNNDMQSWKEVLLAASSNKSTKDQETDGEVYEEFNEPTGKSLTQAQENDDIYDETEVDTKPFKQFNAAAKPSPASLKGRPVVPPVSLRLPDNQKQLKEETSLVEDADDLIYEPIDLVPSPGPSSKLDTSISRMNPSTMTSAAIPPHFASPKLPQTSVPLPKDLESLPPPVPPHRGPEPLPPQVPPHRGQELPPPPPHRGQELPPIPPPHRGQELPPPPPQESVQTTRALPPPPTDPLPAVPQTPKKMTSPNLGKILHPSEDFENLFYGKWDCTGTTDNELTFRRGQIVHVISRDLDKDDWWVGALNDKVGLVPKNYLSPAYEQIR